MYRTVQVMLLMMGLLSTVAATDIFLPSLPSMAVYFGASEDEMQLAIPLYMLGSFLAAPVLGTLSDHFGRRWVMIAGFTFFLLGTGWCLYAPTLNLFLAGRFIQGLGAIAPPVIGWAMIQDLYTADKGATVMSWVGSIISVGPFIAPGLGGYIHESYGWQGNFTLLFLLGTITLLLMLASNLKLKSTKEKDTMKFSGTLKNYKAILMDKPFLCYVSLFAFLGCGEWAYLTVAPFYFEHSLHLSPSIFGLYISGSASFFILGTLCTPFLLKRLGVSESLRIGTLVTVMGAGILVGISFMAADSILLIALTFGIFFFGTAIIWGPSSSRALQRFEHLRGAASAVRTLIIQAAMALGGGHGKPVERRIHRSPFFCCIGYVCCMLDHLSKGEDG